MISIMLELLVLFRLFGSIISMPQIVRKIANYEAEFNHQDNALLINITHPSKSQMLFNRITNHSFPLQLKDLSDNTLELFQVIKDLPDDKIIVNPSGVLVLVIMVGKKSKQFDIQLERVQISNEQSLKKRVEQLQKKLQRKQFEAQFYKEQFNFLLKNLQLKPNIEALQQLYGRDDIEDVLSQSELKQSKFTKNSSKLLSNSSKVGDGRSNIKKQEQKCPNMHDLVVKPTQHPSFLCNLCRQSIGKGNNRFRCDTCDFDLCFKCSTVPLSKRKYCPMSHGLIFGAAPNYLARRCDRCESKFVFQKGYSCVGCDYDQCKKCYQR